MRPLIVRDRMLLLGELSSLVSGELAYKLFDRVTSEGWTPASEVEALGPGLTVTFSQSVADQLTADTLLLLGAWVVASVYTFGVLGFRSPPGRAAVDQSLSVGVSYANAVLLVVFLVCTWQRFGARLAGEGLGLGLGFAGEGGDVGAEAIESINVYGYEATTFLSLVCVVLFRVTYCNRRPSITL